MNKYCNDARNEHFKIMTEVRFRQVGRQAEKKIKQEKKCRNVCLISRNQIIYVNECLCVCVGKMREKRRKSLQAATFNFLTWLLTRIFVNRREKEYKR